MAKKTVRRKTKKDASWIGWLLGAVLIILLNLMWVSLVVWGLIELVLFLKRN